MAKVGRSTITAQNILKFPTNNAKLISAKNLRDFEEIINESKFNLVDDDAYSINFSNPDFSATNIGDALFEAKTAAGGIKATVITITSWTQTSVSTHSHSIGVTPLSGIVNLICTTANNGFAVGDRVTVQVGGEDQDGSSDYWYGISIAWIGTTQFRLLIGNRVSIFTNNGGNLGFASISQAQWNIEVTLLHL